MVPSKTLSHLHPNECKHKHVSFSFFTLLNYEPANVFHEKAGSMFPLGDNLYKQYLLQENSHSTIFAKFLLIILVSKFAAEGEKFD